MDPPSSDAAALAWAEDVQREQDAFNTSSSLPPESSPPPDPEAVANAADRTLASGGGGGGSTGSSGSIASGGGFELTPFSLFPSSLAPSPHHHSPSHSIITLSAAAPNEKGPSPLLSDSPTLQPTQLATDHILNNPDLIVNVWQSNLQQELARILNLVDEYPYIAMDTEFPGIVARPAGSHKTSNDYQYQTLRTNVDLLKIIQLGLCFCDAQGNIHPGTCTWQFNFQFSLSSDMYAQDSIDLLSKSGIDFSAHEKNGIHTADFAEWLMTSGIVLNEDIKWISFHSGFDFGYLLKILTCAPLPSKEDDFFALLQIYFPCIYDIKFLMDSCANLHGGLSKIAETLNVIRIGPQHQAGSDSLLTAATFFKLKNQYFNSATNPIWAETPESRNAVYRELKVHHWNNSNGSGGGSGSSTYSVITNTDPLNEFDTKFLGNLAGLNNDYTAAWKKKQEIERERRHRKEKAIAAGEIVSSDDEDEMDGPSNTQASSISDSKSTSALSSTSSSPNFVPTSNPSYLPITPQRSSSTHHTYSSPITSQHDFPQHNNNASSTGSTKLTPNKPNGLSSMHRGSRYSHDYS